MPREPDTRPEPIPPLCSNMPATLLQLGQTTLSHGVCRNPGGGFDKGAGESRPSILHCTDCHWTYTELPQPWRMWQQNISSFSSSPLSAGAVKCNLLPCATHQAATTAAPILIISEAITARRQSPDILQRQEQKKANTSGMLKRIVKGLDLVQIKTPFLEIFLPILVGTLGILALLRTHIPYEYSEMTMDLPSQQLILMSWEMQGNESKSAFPTGNCGTNRVSALQLGPRGARGMHFFSQNLRNSLERELVFVTSTFSHQVRTYFCLCLSE